PETSSSVAPVTPPASSETVAQEAETTPSSSTEVAAGSTTVVQAGEGPKQVAERAGITVDELFALNGMDPNNYMLYPGQELRVK
ncbi:LysM peptidoglycan-binding domain-containing protein, partial [Vibrio parahaemolyticus]|nr:LysM peptidoglycan-binding domain-containing protein [Vibrio parahaemolyticus]